MTTSTQKTEMRRWLHPFLVALVGILTLIGLAVTASADETGASQPRVGAFDVAGEVLIEPPQHESPGQRLSEAGLRADFVVATSVTANGGAVSVRLGRTGEKAARGAFDIGKATAQIGGSSRISSGLKDVAVSEVKNVKYQASMLQVKDGVAYAQQRDLRFELYVRGGANPTLLSGPPEAAIRSGDIGLRHIP